MTNVCMIGNMRGLCCVAHSFEVDKFDGLTGV